MKRIINAKVGISLKFIFLIAVFSVLSSCEKMSDVDNQGGDSGGSNGPVANEVLIQGMAFTPSTITIVANTTVTWTNKDAVPHTVTSDNGLFESGTITTNGTFSYTFTAAGTYSYHCAVHPSMTAKLTVN